MHRTLLCAAAALMAATFSAHAQFQDVFFIGTDNGLNLDFEAQVAAMAHFYTENGDFTALGGVNWTSGPEALSNGNATDEIGFPRALTQTGGANPQTNIYFNLTAEEARAVQPVRLIIDFTTVQASTTHNVDVLLNGGAAFATRNGINAAVTWIIDTTSGAMGAVAGPNVLRVRRTGGTLSGGTATIQFDYLRLEIDPAPQYINTFRTNDALVRPGEVATLSWVLNEPAATVSIDQGVGDVTAMTTAGAGSVNVQPAANTTYSLTATFNSLTQTKQVTINTSPWSALFEAGTDNASFADFSHEVAADDDYYFAGNYTSAGGPNQAANEVMNDDTNTETVAGRTGNPAIGFERTLRESDPHQNIWFVPAASLNHAAARLRVSADLLSIGSTAQTGNGTHTLEFSLNGIVIRTESNITTPRLVQFETSAVAAAYVQGPNKFTMRRTGGTLAGFVNLDYVNLEYMADTPPAITGVTDDAVLGTHTVAWAATVGKSYRVQKSADAGATWIILSQGFPTGGATSASLFYEDRVTPWADPRPTYRVLVE